MIEYTGCLAVADNAFPADLVLAAAEQWPAFDAAPWHRYDSPLERKWALRDGIHSPALELLGLMATTIRAPGVPDLSLYGAGLHAMWPGDKLDLHLDADRHPQFGTRRAMNAILFVGEWHQEWGGMLEVWPSGSERAITPAHNRLVLFPTDWVHGVPEPIQCPAGVLRRSLALYWWSRPPAEWKPERPRALFLPAPGAPPDPEMDRLRAERARF